MELKETDGIVSSNIAIIFVSKSCFVRKIASNIVLTKQKFEKRQICKPTMPSAFTSCTYQQPSFSFAAK